MTTNVAREYLWSETEAADAFVERAVADGARIDEARAVARLADDTDEAVAISEFDQRSASD